ncbi:ARPP-1 family domain-containing protein [Aridibaculum aurantiacum]|uniref:ARPP-1 family domain-containing protein n=1 Tax=Aridibaculum aurantiacum TaxID=2810307 RepID=UPI001A9696A9|nr:DUF6569 family protein [Aridibaculum aurantiacum]
MADSRILLLLTLLLAAFHGHSQVSELTYNQLEIQYDSAWTYKNLQLIPVRYKDPKIGKEDNHVISLAEAMATKKIKVREVQSKDGADIYTLEMKNDSKENVMVQGGDMLSGGKQDRIFTETKVIKAGTTDYVSVYCVEKGRWDDKPKPFAFRGSANAELRRTVDVNKRQNDVWREIERQYAAAGKVSSTSSILQLFTWGRVTDTNYINYFNQRYRQTDSAFAGFITITGNRIIFCELFSSADLTRIAFPSMLNSAVATAVNNPSAGTPTVDREQLKDFLDHFLMDVVSQKTYISQFGRMQQNAGNVFHLIAYGD